MDKKEDRRTTRKQLVLEQLHELDVARNKALGDLRENTNHRDGVFIVEAIIKLHKAERDLHDELYIDSDSADVEMTELLG